MRHLKAICFGSILITALVPASGRATDQYSMSDVCTREPGSYVNIRARPSTNAKVVTQMKDGNIVVFDHNTKIKYERVF